MADQRDASFTVDGAKRIVEATRWVERQPTYGPGSNLHIGKPLEAFWAIIQGATQRTDNEKKNNWYYTLEERILDVDTSGKQLWTTPNAPRTTEKAINAWEPLSQAIDDAGNWIETPVPNDTYVLVKGNLDKNSHMAYAFELPEKLTRFTACNADTSEGAPAYLVRNVDDMVLGNGFVATKWGDTEPARHKVTIDLNIEGTNQHKTPPEDYGCYVNFEDTPCPSGDCACEGKDINWLGFRYGYFQPPSEGGSGTNEWRGLVRELTVNTTAQFTTLGNNKVGYVYFNTAKETDPRDDPTNHGFGDIGRLSATCWTATVQGETPAIETTLANSALGESDCADKFATVTWSKDVTTSDDGGKHVTLTPKAELPKSVKDIGIAVTSESTGIQFVFTITYNDCSTPTVITKTITKTTTNIDGTVTCNDDGTISTSDPVAVVTGLGVS